MLRQPKPKSELLGRQMEKRQRRFEPEPHTERDEILRRALAHLSAHGVEYVPLAIEEDIQASYEDDDIEDFRETVRGWMRELRNAGRGAA